MSLNDLEDPMNYIDYLVEYKNYLQKIILESEDEGYDCPAHNEELKDVEWEIMNLINKEDNVWEE